MHAISVISLVISFVSSPANGIVAQGLALLAARFGAGRRRLAGRPK
jgi:hypothetical protein